MEYRLSDEVVAAIARSLQIALLTGTDIVDNLRAIRVEVEGDQLTLTDSYREAEQNNIDKMLQLVQEIQTGVSEEK
jgi:hypothetical protein